MRRIGRAVRILATAGLIIGATSARSDEKPKSDPEAVDRILAEWQAKAAAITSVEVEFRRSDKSANWGETLSLGRAILAAPNLAWVEFRSVGEGGKATGLKERLIWDGRSILQFDADQHEVHRYRLPEKWTSSPGPLRLPFFFRMTVDEAKRDHDWAVLRDGPKQIILEASPKPTTSPTADKSVKFILLDRKTFMPKRLIWSDPDSKSRQTFDVIETKVNAVEGLDELLNPCMDSWTVIDMDGWLTRLILK